MTTVLGPETGAHNMDFAIPAEEYQRFRTLIYDESGIALGAQKQVLVVSRLSKCLRELG